MRRENDPTFDTRSTFPITAISASESSTVGSSTYTTENNNSPSTRGHELLVVRSPQEQHDYNQQGSCINLCHAFSPNLKIHWIKLIMAQVCMCFVYFQILNNWFWMFLVKNLNIYITLSKCNFKLSIAALFSLTGKSLVYKISLTPPLTVLQYYEKSGKVSDHVYVY
jgi:hypothetical protein